MKKLFTFMGILMLYVVLWNGALAQAPPQAWFKTFDGSSGDEIRFVRVDKNNNIVVTGVSGTSSTMLDVVTRSYASDGTLKWSHSWNNTTYNFDDRVQDMAIAPNGNIIIAGYSKITSSSQDNNSNGFVFALDSMGNFLWQDSLKGQGYTSNNIYHNRNIVQEIAIDQNNNVYIVGQGTGSNTNNQYDQMLIAKYDASGQQQWQHFQDNSTAFPYQDIGNSIAVDTAGNSYTAGATSLTNSGIDFGMWAFNSAGSFQWIATASGTQNNVSEAAIQIIADNSGNTYTLGVNSESKYVLVKLDAGGLEQWTYLFDTVTAFMSSSFTGADKYLSFDAAGNIIVAAPMSGQIGVAKVTNAGNLTWLNLISGSAAGGDQPYRVVTDLNNNIYVGGAWTTSANTYFDIGLMKLDENGNKLWSVSHAGPAGTNDKGLSMDIAADGGIYVGGYATGYSATSDYFLAKYQQAPIVGITDPAHDKSVTIYPNPVERVIFIRTDKGLIGNQYFVYDVQGKVILKGVFKENRLSVKDLANGLYTLSIPAEKINQPFIKK